MSKFVLRPYCFGYNDENFYISGWQAGKVYDDREDAEATYRKLQLQYLRDLQLGEHEYVFDGDPKYLEKISNFIKDRTGKTVFDGDYIESYCDGHTAMNDDDLFEFGEFADMRGYKLIEFDDDPVFYVLFDPREGEYVQYFDEDFQGPVFANSLDELNDLITEHADDAGWSGKGSLEELSENPVLLRQTIDSAKGIKYDESRQRLTISRPGPGEAVALNSLLRKPIFEVREMDIDAIKRLENEIMEEMY